jgi:hypothetical protein
MLGGEGRWEGLGGADKLGALQKRNREEEKVTFRNLEGAKIERVQDIYMATV